MTRTIDWKCPCGQIIHDVLADEGEHHLCQCGVTMEQIWWGRHKANAQWGDETAVLVHVDPKTGDIRYPGRHDAKLKDGYERHYLRSLPEVNRFEKERGVVNHVMHYDGNGRALDDMVGGEKLAH